MYWQQLVNLQIQSKSSHPEVLFKKGVLKNFAKFTGKNLCQSLFQNKMADWRPSNLLKKRFQRTFVSLEVLRIFKEHVYCRVPPGRCFCQSIFIKITDQKFTGNLLIPTATRNGHDKLLLFAEFSYMTIICCISFTSVWFQLQKLDHFE